MESRAANSEAEDPTHFSTSKGTRVKIAAMPTPYLENAIRKLEREIDRMVGELEAMRAERRFREFQRKL